MKVIDKLLYITMLIILFPIIILSQEDEYTVLTKSGEVLLLNDAMEEISNINLGDKLYKDDNLIVKKRGYLVIVNSEMQSLELSTEGIYNIAKIDTLFSIKKKSITENITKFILNEMATGKEQYNEMKTLGSVVRVSSDIIELATPKYGVIMDTLYNFSWYPLPNDSSYIIRIFNKNGSTIFMHELSDTSFQLNLAGFNLLYENEYFWTINTRESIDRKIDSAGFKLMSPKDVLIVNRDIENIELDFKLQETPLKNYVIAKYLISRELYELALTYMSKSINMLPDSEFYWSSYIRLLMDIGLSRKAVIAWNSSPFSKK